MKFYIDFLEGLVKFEIDWKAIAALGISIVAYILGYAIINIIL